MTSKPKLSIYLLSTNEGVGYDCYDAHVVIAFTEAQARSLVPSGDEGSETWVTHSSSECTIIGTPTKGATPDVVLSSFNAG